MPEVSSDQGDANQAHDELAFCNHEDGRSQTRGLGGSEGVEPSEPSGAGRGGAGWCSGLENQSGGPPHNAAVTTDPSIPGLRVHPGEPKTNVR